MPHSADFGTLYVVATPIGNLDDICFRAIDTLKQCDIIACEDTRHSKRLCQHHNIDTTLTSYHQHNEQSAGRQIIEQLQSGACVALVSDAGTPLISDPGYVLVEKAHKAGIRVIPIPGPSAIITLLSVAGLDTSQFCFYGFLPNKSTQRHKALSKLHPNKQTTVLYESSHRILACLDDMADIWGGDHLIVVGRELTKTFETIYHSTIESVSTQLHDNPVEQKGEFVIAIDAVSEIQNTELSVEAQSLAVMLQPVLPPKQAAKIVAEHHCCEKKTIYQFILALTKDVK